jgi:hypothetical protein
MNCSADLFDNQIKIVKRDELRATPRTGDVAIDDVIVRERIDVLLFDQAAGILPLAEFLGQLVFVHVRSPFLVGMWTNIPAPP